MAEARIVEIERELTRLKVSFGVYEAGIEKQKADLVDQIGLELTRIKLGMNEVVEGARAEFSVQRMELQNLHEATGIELKEMKQNMKDIEFKGKARDDKCGEKKSLMMLKNMVPEKLKSQDEWKQWKGDVEDFCEETFEGMSEVHVNPQGLICQHIDHWDSASQLIRHLPVIGVIIRPILKLFQLKPVKK